MTDQGSSAVVVIPHTIVGDLRKADITMSNRTSTVGEVLAWQPTDTSRGILSGPLAPAIVFRNDTLIIIGLPALAGKKLTRVLTSRLDTDDVSTILTSADGFSAAMRAIGFEISATDHAFPLHLGKSEAVLKPSWRDDVPETVLADMDKLLDEIVRLGKQKLEQDGGIQPFCLSLDLNDHIDVDYSREKVDDEQRLLSTYFQVMTRERDKHRAFAIIQNYVTNHLMALNIWLEHRDGPALICIHPYKKQRSRGEYKFIKDDITAVTETHRVWVPQSDVAAN